MKLNLLVSPFVKVYQQVFASQVDPIMFCIGTISACTV
jgi:hypothetical protein